MQLRQWMTLISHDQPVLVYFWNSCCLPWKASQSRMGEQTYFGTPHLGPVTIEIQRGCQMMSENPPPMHGALVQSRSSKDGSRWKQMEAMGGRPFEILWVWSRWMELSFSPALLTQCGTVRHRVAGCTRHPFDPKRSKAMRRQGYWHGVHNPRLHSWNLQHDQSVNLISCDTVRHHQRAKTSYEASRNSQSLVSQLHNLNGSGHITWIFYLSSHVHVRRQDMSWRYLNIIIYWNYIFSLYYIYISIKI